MEKKVKIDEVIVGMFIHNLNINWINTPFLNHSFLITSEKMISQLKQVGLKEVTIDIDKGLDREDDSIKVKEEPPPVKVAPKPTQSIKSAAIKQFDKQDAVLLQQKDFKEELAKAKEIKNEMKRATGNFIRSIGKDQSGNIKGILDISNSIAESLNRHPNAMASMLSLKSSDEDLYRHSMNISIHAASLGKALHLSPTDIRSLGMGGLLHDLGKTKLPGNIANSNDKLSEKDMITYKHHVNHTINLIDKLEGIPPNVLSIVAQHHELCNGHGYPCAIRGSKIHLLAKITAVVDNYDRLLSGFNGKPPLTPDKAMKALYALRGKLEQKIVDRFIQFTGLYPVGSYVQLGSGAVVVVVTNNADNPKQPIVRKVVSRVGYRVNSNVLIDLSVKGKVLKEYAIRGVVRETDYNLPVYSDLEQPDDYEFL